MPNNGAEGRTRTGTAYATAPSRQRVYQFHHFGFISIEFVAKRHFMKHDAVLRIVQEIHSLLQRVTLQLSVFDAH